MKDWVEQRVHTCYWTHDLSCVITMLTILGERFNQMVASDVMHAADGLNAGRLRSQCGLVEGVLLYIGIYGRQKGLDKETVQSLCFSFASCYKKNFKSVICSELRPEGFFSGQPPHLCEKLTCRSIEFAIRYIEENVVGESGGKDGDGAGQ